MKKMRLSLTNQHYVNKSAAELFYILQDAREAADAVRGFDRKAEEKYLEQIDDAASVLAALRRGEKP